MNDQLINWLNREINTEVNHDRKSTYHSVLNYLNSTYSTIEVIDRTLLRECLIKVAEAGDHKWSVKLNDSLTGYKEVIVRTLS